MKKSISVSLQIILIVIATNVSGQVVTKQELNRKWSGKYFYKEKETFATYDLIIKENNSCIYKAEGIQTYFNVSCIGRKKGNSYEIYFAKINDGAYYPADWIDKKKPIMTLYYKKNKLYTDEGQTNKEFKGGHLLFKRKK